MADIYVPGVKSRFNSEKLIDDLMKVERAPKERAEKNVERLQEEKGWWREVGGRLGALREGARYLYSFQNPFNDRLARSSNEGAISGTATREAEEQNRAFTVRQIAQADRFLSDPLDENFNVEAGAYAFGIGDSEVSFNFRGGSLRDFINVLNQQGRDRVKASLIAVRQGTKSLLIESKITGEANRLLFKGAAEPFGVAAGLLEQVPNAQRTLQAEPIEAAAQRKVTVPVEPGLSGDSPLVLRFESAVARRAEEPYEPPQPPPGPAIPNAGGVTYGGITIENEPSSVSLPPWTPPPAPVRVDDLGVLSLEFSDGTSAALPPLRDGDGFETRQYPLKDIAGGKTISAISIDNKNTHRDVTVKGIEVFDPSAQGGYRPRNPVSTAQDAILSMEGVEVTRPSNSIDDLIPGVTLTLSAPTSETVHLTVEPDRKAAKDAIINLVGNYNRLMAELNVLSRKDDRVIAELSYLEPEEREALQKRLGALLGDSTITQMRSGMQRVAAAPYPSPEGSGLTLLSQIGISTGGRQSGGIDQSRLRGYLEIDEKALDTALQDRLRDVAALFGSDTNGDLVADTGVAFNLEALAKPYVESGGIISLKTGNVDTRIAQEQRRIDTLDRQLALKEAELKRQYGQMEGAYTRMEQLSGSLDRFNDQNSGNRR
ncbi:MAG: flagellar filament capping protein FliD [Treponema sp.]|jgi:flagellar hook-associated protein 2|nr:flagellar filament capping protein FliD [Treponema sp.]